MAERGKKKELKKALILIYVLLVIALIIIVYALPKVSDVFTSTLVLEYGQMQVTDDVTCYIIRDEEVVKAKNSGAINYYIEEGTKSRKGTKVADIGGTGYSCPNTGVVSFYHDGYEDDFTSEKMRELDREKVTELEIDSKSTKRDSAASGEPLYKIVDNDIWYAACWVESASVIKYQKGATISFVLPLDTVKGTVIDVIDNDGEWLVILEFNRYYEDMAKLRRVDATIITEDDSGLIVPNESLTQKDGKTGVYVKGIGGDFVFQRVKIITTDGEYSLVESSSFYEEGKEGNVKIDTVNIYDEIRKKP